MTQEVCPECLGSRLNEHARSILLNGKSIDELCNLSIDQLFLTIKQLAENLDQSERVIFNSVFDTIDERLKNMIDLGLGHLTLNRSTPHYQLENISDYGCLPYWGQDLPGFYMYWMNQQ